MLAVCAIPHYTRPIPNNLTAHKQIIRSPGLERDLDSRFQAWGSCKGKTFDFWKEIVLNHDWVRICMHRKLTWSRILIIVNDRCIHVCNGRAGVPQGHYSNTCGYYLKKIHTTSLLRVGNEALKKRRGGKLQQHQGFNGRKKTHAQP